MSVVCGHYFVLRGQRGAAGLMAMLFLLVVVGFSAVTLLTISNSDMHDSTAQNDGVTALFLAETGVERASRLYSTGTPCDPTLLPPFAAPLAYGRGTFAATTTPPVIVGGRCRLQVIGRVGVTTRTIQVDLATALSDISLLAISTGIKNNTNVAPITWNHTIPVAAGPNRIVVVGVTIRRTGAQAVLPGAQTTYGGVPLVPLGGFDHPTDGVRVEWLYLLNPPTGTRQVSVRLQPGARAVAGAVSFSGVDQLVPVDVGPMASAGNFPTNPSVTLNTVTDKAWVVGALGVRLTATATVAAGQNFTPPWNTATGGGPANGIRGAGSYSGPQSPAGAVTLSWTLNPTPPPPGPFTNGWMLTAVALRPAPRIYVSSWREL